MLYIICDYEGNNDYAKMKKYVTNYNKYKSGLEDEEFFNKIGELKSSIIKSMLNKKKNNRLRRHLGTGMN